jgi:hypothetical protein
MIQLMELSQNPFIMRTMESMPLSKYVMISVLFIAILSGCSKEETKTATLPVITTNSVTEITSTTAVSGGYISSDGGSAITARGICWSLIQNPTLADDQGNDGSVGTGAYTCNIFGLTGNTTYYIRAFANNSAGTSYGDVKTFTTSALSEFALTQAASGVTSVMATLNATVNANYITTDVYFEYGLTIGYGSVIMALQSPVTGNQNTSVSASLTSLTALTTYHYRVKTVNSSGTAFGNDMIFTANYITGETALGGIIFYVDSTMEHGLVCALVNQGIAAWGCFDTTIPGADGTAIGTGYQNTMAIMNTCPEDGIAARLCGDLVLNGYSDWFLPSVDELVLMYPYVDDPSGGYYWSSSEKSATQAWCGPWGAFFNSYGKTINYKVRAIRVY